MPKRKGRTQEETEMQGVHCRTVKGRASFMDFKQNVTAIENGTAVLGIEFGSTRIKSVLINAEYETIASGSYAWENDLRDGIGRMHLNPFG